MSLLQRCIANRQWQNAANIAGCSVHAVRRQYDPDYQPEHSQAPVSGSASRAAADELELWCLRVKARARAARWSLRELSEYCGLRPQSVAELVRGEWKPSPETRAAIDAGLTVIERRGLTSRGDPIVTPEQVAAWREEVRERLRSIPMTMSQISRAAGCYATWLSNILTGQTLVSQANVTRVEQILGTLEAGRMQ